MLGPSEDALVQMTTEDDGMCFTSVGLEPVSHVWIGHIQLYICGFPCSRVSRIVRQKASIAEL